MIRCQEERKRMLASLSQTPPPPERAAAEASVQEETIPPAGEVPQLDGEINRVQNGEEQEASAATTTSCMPDGSLPAATPGSQSLTISQGCGKSVTTKMEKAILSILARSMRINKLKITEDEKRPNESLRGRYRDNREKREKEHEATSNQSVLKTPVSQLQEWCILELKTLPHYITTIQEDPVSPYSTVVEIAGREYGRASYLNKKQAKQMAAEATLRMLWPNSFPSSHLSTNNSTAGKPPTQEDPYRLAVDDESVLSLTNFKSPAQVLQEHGNRRHTTITFTSEEVTHSSLTSSSKRAKGSGAPGPLRQYRIEARLDGLVAEGIGKNKREAKQRAAQLMLKKLHPEATSWGDLLDAEDGESPPGISGGGGSEDGGGSDSEDDSAAPSLRLLEQLKDEMRKELASQRQAIHN